MFATTTRILIVDDMITMSKLMTKVCNQLGFTDITEASDGSSAYDLIQNANPPIEMIISDYEMPDSTGMDLLKRLRNESRFLHLPFLILYTQPTPTQITEATKAGADDYLEKPFDASRLTEKLKNIYQKRKS